MLKNSRAIEIKNRHSRQLLALPGVVGVGIGAAHPGDPRSGPALIVYVVDEAAAAKLQGASLFGALTADAEEQDLPIRLDVSGKFHAGEAVMPPLRAGAPMIAPYDERVRPVQEGYSAGRIDPKGTGTGGLVVIDPKTKQLYLAGNCHVLNGNNDNKAYVTVQPGPDDGGTEADRIGVLHRYLTIQPDGNKMDAGIVMPDKTTTFSLDYPTVGALPGFYNEYSVGWSMIKVGRTTGAVSGTVESVHTDITIDYGGWGGLNKVGFLDQTVVSNGSSDIQLGGDSGSIWLRKDDKYVCMFSFANTGTGKKSVGFPFAWFAAMFGVNVAIASTDRAREISLGDDGDAMTSGRLSEEEKRSLQKRIVTRG